MSKLACAVMLAVGLTFLGTGAEAEAGNSFFLSVGGPRGGGVTYSGYRGGGYTFGPSGGFYRRTTYVRPLFAPPISPTRHHHHHHYHRPPCNRGGYYYGY